MADGTAHFAEKVGDTQHIYIYIYIYIYISYGAEYTTALFVEMKCLLCVRNMLVIPIND